MSDLLVRLYALPETKKLKKGYVVRRAAAYDRSAILQWVGKNFSPQWAGEAEVAFSRQPVSCFIALRQGDLVGFACYEATCRGFFGPTGVVEGHRGEGLGTRLLLASLRAMGEIGYAYAVIGAVGEGEKTFYMHAVGAIEIPDSAPGIYTPPLGSGGRKKEEGKRIWV